MCSDRPKVFPGVVGWGLSRGPGWGAFGVRETGVPALVVLLTRCVTSDNPPAPTKLLFLYLSMGRYLADYVALKIK